MNLRRRRRDQSLTTPREEAAMSEFGEIFAGGIATTVFIYGSLAMASLAAATVLWMTRTPREESAVELASGSKLASSL
jgi:hypothetical protein